MIGSIYHLIMVFFSLRPQLSRVVAQPMVLTGGGFGRFMSVSANHATPYCWLGHLLDQRFVGQICHEFANWTIFACLGTKKSAVDIIMDIGPFSL